MDIRLLTPELGTLIEKYPLYSQEEKGKDAECIAIFALGSVRWFVLEGKKEEDDVIMFGVVVGLVEDEYGYFSLRDLAELKIKHPQFEEPLIVRQQPGFQPTPLKYLADDRLQELINRIHKSENVDGAD